jgi:hypothetical protein
MKDRNEQIMKKHLLKIIVNEQEELGKDHLSRKIMEYLLEEGCPGATMRRGSAGIDHGGRFTHDLLEDNYFNNLPILIEAVATVEFIERIKGGLAEMIPHGQITVSAGTDKDASHYVVKVYTSEKKTKILDQDESDRILTLLQEKNVLWATVSKGISGFGRGGEIHSQHLFSVGGHLPLIIEGVVEKEKLPGVLEELKELVQDGIIFTAPVDLIQSR